MDPEKALLSIGWTCLKLKDLQIFASPTAWVNDNCIDFYYEHLMATRGYKKTFLLYASTAALMVYENPEELEMIIGDLHLPDYTYWLIPVNDKTNPSVPGGSHWSLLFYNGANKAFYHLDS